MLVSVLDIFLFNEVKPNFLSPSPSPKEKIVKALQIKDTASIQKLYVNDRSLLNSPRSLYLDYEYLCQ